MHCTACLWGLAAGGREERVLRGVGQACWRVGGRASERGRLSRGGDGAAATGTAEHRGSWRVQPLMAHEQEQRQAQQQDVGQGSQRQRGFEPAQAAKQQHAAAREKAAAAGGAERTPCQLAVGRLPMRQQQPHHSSCSLRTQQAAGDRVQRLGSG